MFDGKPVLFDHPMEVRVRHTYETSTKYLNVCHCIKREGVDCGMDTNPPPLYQQYPIPIVQFHIRLEECISTKLHVTSLPESLSGSTFVQQSMGKIEFSVFRAPRLL